MSDLSLLLPAVLARERGVAERLAALADLAGLAGDPEAVAVLLQLAADEPDERLRTALLAAVAAVDITRLPDRDGHAAAWAVIAAREPAPALRLLAVERLAGCGHGGDAAIVALAVDDLDPAVRLAAWRALVDAARPPEDAAAGIAAYAPRASPDEAAILLRLVPALPDAAGQAVLAALLAPTLPAGLRAAAAAGLRSRTRPGPEARAALRSLIAAQPDDETLRWAVAALTAATTVDAALLADVLALATATPSRAGILAALAAHLDADPALTGRIEDAVLASTSSALWQAAIALLGQGTSARVPLAGLAAPSAATRAAALAWAEEAVATRPEAVIAALARHLPREPLAHLRLRQAALLAGASVVPAEAGAALVARLQRESIPGLRHDLCQALLVCRIPPGPERAALLAAFAAILGEPETPPGLREALSAHLQRLAAESGGADCLPALLAALAQAGSLDEIERLDRLVRALEPDPTRHAALTHGLMRRYHHIFPQDPLTQWARDIAAAAKAGALPPTAVLETVRLTGASWLLEGTDFAGDRDLLLASVRSAIAADRSLDAERAIREAYEQKTIRRSDLAGIVRLVAFRPRWHHLADQVLRICRSEQVATPALVEAAWPVLLCDPGSDLAYAIAEHFSEHAADPAIAARARASCVPAEFGPWLLVTSDPDYTGRAWPIFTILAACGPDAVAAAFALPPHAAFHLGLAEALRSRQRGASSYWKHPRIMRAAAQLWRACAGDPALARLRLGLGRLLTGNRPARPRQHTGGDEGSRVWNDFVAGAGLAALEPPMPEIGAELWIDFCQQLAPAPGQPPAKLPPVPSGVSLEHLRRQWPFPAGP